MLSLLTRLEKTRLVPVVSLPSVEAALSLAEILLQCNLPVVEVTFRTPHAAAGIAAIKNNFPQIELLAGTILTPKQADSALEAGATAIVSPGFSPQLAAHCTSQNVPFFPGVCTPSEVQTALESGCDRLKFFPAEKMGGTGMLSLFRSLYKEVSFMPTGGISLNNIKDYLQLDNVLCCGGSWLCPEQLMAENKWEEIKSRVRKAVQVVNT
ncbi:bifunctional 4-hydroxy-2-oxoglutarate aldolase/2-dehydro-3-deoxy-phosphogluconate aldolase [Desulfogranum japonicum]|uniref:bifunctional 4-hydroxy-2-oxoglutarate aldolase/2-dehydro-3-deoxy-phosphogluconate aldolase n=1 Tax=Desulfogranum japonicum TaxID=231447 RepID=UPI000424F103|nr:bifunctional 4-hydroxy-2-oxoglutarate aldolase/2-dehydro-3-deoxy-phosphogluconate aldolase [Desulfogranum japonicum]